MTSAIWPRWRSSGSATLVATVSGLAPGSWALTEMVGKSTCGSGATGSLVKGEHARERDAQGQQGGRHRPGDERRGDVHRPSPAGADRSAGRRPRQPQRQPVEVQIDHRRGEQRQQLAEHQSADDGDAERLAEFGAGAGAQHQRQRAEDRRHGGHQDRPEPQQAGLIDRLARRQAFDALGLQREIDHHDGVFLDDADQQNDADDGDDVEIVAAAASATAARRRRPTAASTGW